MSRSFILIFCYLVKTLSAKIYFDIIIVVVVFVGSCCRKIENNWKITRKMPLFDTALQEKAIIFEIGNAYTK